MLFDLPDNRIDSFDEVMEEWKNSLQSNVVEYLKIYFGLAANINTAKEVMEKLRENGHFTPYTVNNVLLALGSNYSGAVWFQMAGAHVVKFDHMFDL